MSNTFALAEGSTTIGNGVVETRSGLLKNASVALVNQGMEIGEKEGVWVPAHSSRRFYEFSLLEKPYRKCGFARNPKVKEDVTISFSEKNSPYTFNNLLMFVQGGVDHRIKNSFYIGRLTNIRESLTYEEESELDCNGNLTGGTRRIYNFYSPNRFYIRYLFGSFGAKGGNDRMKER